MFSNTHFSQAITLAVCCLKLITIDQYKPRWFIAVNIIYIFGS
ncbi:hypothetical protein PCIT_a1896 [Pseudoalteromonas citrea]|uniref:Uncharacterized protein n=1 Tax=Pseudoalteromonas citrea TaxID=43655 RepID=A0AAD4AJ99_9GAMM|nr:hypothetical protein PCIT_a1896 [Pseudoalteromonas citrea]